MEVERIRHELDIFYDQKTFFRKKGEIRLLQLFVTDYEIFDSSKFGFVYEAFNDRDIIAVLRKILLFKPDIIMVYDSIMVAKKYYNHDHILYINDNDYSAYTWLLPHIRINKNEIHFYIWKEVYNRFEKWYGDDSIYRHVICNTLLPGNIFMNPELEIPEKFDTDIVVVAGSNSSLSRVKVYIEYMCEQWMRYVEQDYLKEKLKKVLWRMIDIFYERMDETGELVEEEEAYISEFWDLMGKDSEFFQTFSAHCQEYFFKLLRMLVGYSAYRRLIIKWIIEGGYGVDLWGETWENEQGMEQYYKGKISSREELKRVYNSSKICLFTNPDFGLHCSVFEMISSKSLCIAYHNDNISVASLKDYFVDGESIVLYKNKKELLEKINFYLHHMDKRRGIINRGYQIVKRHKLYREYQLTQTVEKAVEYAKKNMNMK